MEHANQPHNWYARGCEAVGEPKVPRLVEYQRKIKKWIGKISALNG
jgi:hypothetical protein